MGSCIANIGLILGLTALIAPPAVDDRLIRREVPLMILGAFAVPLALWGGAITRWEAVLFVVVSIAFTIMSLTMARMDNPPVEANDQDGEPTNDPAGHHKAITLIALTAVGLAVLIAGGELFVAGARRLALALGMSERLIGLTIVAIGTSLPELAASLVAALRGYSGLAVGNVVGSNIFNVFLVLGVVGLIGPIEGSLSALRFDLAFLVGMTLLGALTMRAAKRVTRPEGCLLLAGYVTFIVLATIS